MTAWGLDKLHSFDSCKFGRIAKKLSDAGIVSAFRQPPALADHILQEGHTKKYRKGLQQSAFVASVLELPIGWLPISIVESCVLSPMRLMSSGTVEAAKLALTHGVGINLGGGFHHASADHGHGFCVYADISFAVREIQKIKPDARIMIVDADAHRGDGYERDTFVTDVQEDTDNASPRKLRNVYILDAYTPDIFPGDDESNSAINASMYFTPDDTDAKFLRRFEKLLKKSVREFNPDIVLYNAGTDILDGDPLSGLSYSREAVIKRDEVVFDVCGFSGRKGQTFIPVCMMLSGGYQKVTADVIADSLANIHHKFNGALSSSWVRPDA